MQKTKYMLSTMLIVMCLFLTGELQMMVVNWNTGAQYEGISCYLEYVITSEDTPDELRKFKQAVKSAADGENIGIIVNCQEYVSDFETVSHMYCVGNAAEYLEKELGGTYEYKSVLVGSESYDIRSIDDLQKLQLSVTIRICGDKPAINAASYKLKGALSEFEVFQDVSIVPAVSGGNMYLNIQLGCFGAALVLILLFNSTAAKTMKKEFTIKYVYGESRVKLIGKYWLADVLVYGCVTAIASLVISRINSLLDCMGYIVIFTLGIFVISLLCYIPMVSSSPVDVLKGGDGIKAVLNANRVLKTALSVLIVCVVTLFVAALKDSLGFIQSAELFEQHSEHSFCNIWQHQSLHDVSTEELRLDHYNLIAWDFYDRTEPLLIKRVAFPVYSSGDGYSGSSQNDEFANGFYIFANSNAIDYFRESISDFKDVEITADYVIIGPEELVTEKKINEILESDINNKYGWDAPPRYSREDIQIVKTKKSYTVFAMDGSSSGSNFGTYRNEIVVICTVPENKMDWNLESMGSNNFYMLKIDDSLKEELMDKYHYTRFVITNCKEQYDHEAYKARIGLIYCGVFSIILIILEVTILSFVVRLQFDMNKIELCVKKVLGYTLMARYGEIIAETLATSFICCVLSVFAMSKLDITTISPLKVSVITSVILLVAEFVIIMYNAVKLEKANIQKILKGGAL